MTKHKMQILPDKSYSEMVKEITLPDEDIQDPNIKNKLDNLINFFEETGIPYDKFDPDFAPKLDLDKTAYPNIDHFVSIPGQHDTQKWLNTVKELFYKEKNGIDRKTAIRQSTFNWKLTETYDFLNWLKFYEEGTHLKYKFAQVWYENGAPGYFLHIKKDQPVNNSSVSGNDIDNAKDSISNEMTSAEKKQIIEKQRHKIIGRLDSAEKLLRSQDGQLYAGKELESLLEAIYQLKKKLQMINKVSTSTRLYEDMIIREANILTKRGFVKAGQMLHSLSQMPSTPPPAPPNQGSGSAGGVPSMGPGTPQTPPESAGNDMSVVPSKGMAKFLENLDTNKISTLKDAHKEDNLEIDDSLNVEDVEEELMVSEAQDAAIPPTPSPTADKKIEDNSKKPLVTEIKKDEEPIPVPHTNKDFDNMIDAAFSNLTVDDVVAKLEDLAKIFKTREVPRQLSIVDMMLDSLGLASYFPSLSEATNKALESNNYISTRVEDILSKLRGSMKTREVDLRGEDIPASSPEVDQVKKNLKTQQDKEKTRKELRKAQENQELESQTKETPEIEIEEDLSQPAIPPTPPVPPKPGV